MARRRKGYKNWIDYAVILLFPVMMFGAIIANQIEPKSTADKARPYSIIMIVADDLTVKFVSEYYNSSVKY